MDVWGYVRVSSTDQNEDRQLVAMRDHGVPDKNIFVDKQSGKDFNRPAYQRMIRKLKQGDLVYVTSIDRLGRNYEDIQDQWRLTTREKQTDICVLDMPLLDTRREKNLLGSFIADLVLQVLSFVAQTERENIKRRQAEGIAAARARGVVFGHEYTPLPCNFPEVFAHWNDGLLNVSQAARAVGMCRSTWRRRARLYRQGIEAGTLGTRTDCRIAEGGWNPV